MLSLGKLFSEAANVPNSQANGLTVPFGIINPTERNNLLLSDAQNFYKKSAEEQAEWMNKVFQRVPDFYYKYLQESEFSTVTNDMAFDAAKRIAKSRSADQYDPEDYLYKIGEKTKSKMVPRTSEGLADKDKLGIWSSKGPETSGGKEYYKLLKKRFKRE